MPPPHSLATFRPCHRPHRMCSSAAGPAPARAPRVQDGCPRGGPALLATDARNTDAGRFPVHRQAVDSARCHPRRPGPRCRSRHRCPRPRQPRRRHLSPPRRPPYKEARSSAAERRNDETKRSTRRNLTFEAAASTTHPHAPSPAHHDRGVPRGVDLKCRCGASSSTATPSRRSLGLRRRSIARPPPGNLHRPNWARPGCRTGCSCPCDTRTNPSCRQARSRDAHHHHSSSH